MRVISGFFRRLSFDERNIYLISAVITPMRIQMLNIGSLLIADPLFFLNKVSSSIDMRSVTDIPRGRIPYV